MNSYTRDPRITAGPNDSFMVDVHGTDFFVSRPASWWVITPAPIDVDLASNWVAGYGSEDEAFRTLIGEPQ